MFRADSVVTSFMLEAGASSTFSLSAWTRRPALKSQITTPVRPPPKPFLCRMASVLPATPAMAGVGLSAAVATAAKATSTAASSQRRGRVVIVISPIAGLILRRPHLSATPAALRRRRGGA